MMIRMMRMILIGSSLSARHSSKCFDSSLHWSLKPYTVGHIVVSVYIWEAETLKASIVCTAVKGGGRGAPPPRLRSDFSYKIVIPTKTWGEPIHLCVPNIKPSTQLMFSKCLWSQFFHKRLSMALLFSLEGKRCCFQY